MSNINTNIRNVCIKINSDIKTDFGGGATLEKTLLISYLVHIYKLKSFVEIGVYRGKCLFPVAYSINCNGGKTYGIDPYSTDIAREKDIDIKLKKQIDNFLDNSNFKKIYRSVLQFKHKCGYGKSIKILHKSSEKSLDYFIKNKISIDLLHIDGNHDIKFVKNDYLQYYKLVKNGGFIIFDDIDWKSVNVVYKKAKLQCYEIFKCETFGILYKSPKLIFFEIISSIISKNILNIYNKIISEK